MKLNLYKTETSFTFFKTRGLKVLLILFSLFFTVNLHGQAEHKKNYSPIWSFHQNDINIHGISLGLFSLDGSIRNTNTNGVKLELIGLGLFVPLVSRSPVAQNEKEFLLIQEEPISETINGLNLSATGTVCNCITNGVSAGMIGQINYQVNGVSASFFMNLNQVHNGLMAAFFVNDVYQIKGVQFGATNYAGKMRGLQIGIFNKTQNLRGIQIGLWNVNQRRKLPFINWNFSEYWD